MNIQYPQGVPEIEDERIQHALTFLGVYNLTLRNLFGALPEETQAQLSARRNSYLANGITDAYVCKNGVVALVKNSFEEFDVKVKVVVPDDRNQTMVEFFNGLSDKIFTFVDPVSKLVSKGNKVTFENSPHEGQNLVVVFIVDSDGRDWLPQASVVFFVGWDFVKTVDVRESARECAQSSIEGAFTVSNLGSASQALEVLARYRTILDDAKSELEMQEFLAQHPELLSPEHDEVRIKPSLGGEREPDFAFSTPSAGSVRWSFVEIERPDKPIFTKSENFQFSHEFTQAKQQLLQWDSLLAKDHAFFSKRFEGLQRPDFHLVYGRDRELDDARRDAIAAEFDSSANRFFSTFDDLGSRFERIVQKVFHQHGVRH